MGLLNLLFGKFRKKKPVKMFLTDDDIPEGMVAIEISGMIMGYRPRNKTVLELLQEYNSPDLVPVGYEEAENLIGQLVKYDLGDKEGVVEGKFSFHYTHSGGIALSFIYRSSNENGVILQNTGSYLNAECNTEFSDRPVLFKKGDVFCSKGESCGTFYSRHPHEDFMNLDKYLRQQYFDFSKK